METRTRSIKQALMSRVCFLDGTISSVGVAQESGPSQSPELWVFLHCALEVDHEDNVAIGSRRVLVTGALERAMSTEHLPFHLDLVEE